MKKIAKMFHNYESGKKNFGFWHHKSHEAYSGKLISMYHYFHPVFTQNIETGIYIFLWHGNKFDLEGLLDIIEYTSKTKPFKYADEALCIIEEFNRRVEKFGN